MMKLHQNTIVQSYVGKEGIYTVSLDMSLGISSLDCNSTSYIKFGSRPSSFCVSENLNVAVVGLLNGYQQVS